MFASTVDRHPDQLAVDDGRTERTYRQLARDATAVAEQLRAVGIRPGDRVGIRLASGTAHLYTAILGALAAGAAYVPVDADDPVVRSAAIWEAAGVRATVDDGGVRAVSAAPAPPPARDGRRPRPSDDAWVIFTSGSTGRPKGVAVSHQAAAAFVDAEAGLFLPDSPLAPGDRVLAGLSVAFDASCEEMWLAWRSGACLVPVDRSLVRAGADLGPFARERAVTALSTVPTLAGVLDPGDLAGLRLLVLGGEACPPELARLLVRPGLEVWNTYGPTEATVVTTAARLDRHVLDSDDPVPIGRPLDGYAVAVVDPDGHPVPWGTPGELIVGGVGLGRYLDTAGTATWSPRPSGFRPAPSLGWERAYFTGDVVWAGAHGLHYRGRTDDQVKIAGRRLELGEVDALARRLPAVRAACSALRQAPAGAPVLAVYVVPTGDAFDAGTVRRGLMAQLPAGVAPVVVPVDELPVRTSGKVDRHALPWPPPARPPAPQRPAPAPGRHGDDLPVAWLGARWQAVLGPVPLDRDSDFFASGGTSFTAAQLVSAIRARYPAMSVGDAYRFPTLEAMAGRLAELTTHGVAVGPSCRTPRWFTAAQLCTVLGILALTGARWLVVLAAAAKLLGAPSWAPSASWPVIAAAWLALSSPPARVATAAAACRISSGRLRPGRHRRGGTAHFRLWACERVVAACGLGSLAGTRWMRCYARALGCTVESGAVLHSLPPVTGLASYGAGTVVEPDVDCSGWWLDGRDVHVGRVDVGPGASVGSRSTLLPDTAVGPRAEVDPGTCVTGAVPEGRRWSGSPGRDNGPAGAGWPCDGARSSSRWQALHDVVPTAVGVVPVAAALPALVVLRMMGLQAQPTFHAALASSLELTPLTAVVWVLSYALLVVIAVRSLGRLLRTGTHPVHSPAGLAARIVDDLLAQSRRLLFPLHASLLTPLWLCLLGARVGRRTEISTVHALPALLTVDDGGFLADDTLMAPRRLRNGWQHLGEGTVGRRAFVGNSAIVEAGRPVPDDALVGVLSSIPADARRATSWLGMPPIELPRTPHPVDARRTFDPPPRLVMARAAVEMLRVVPVIASVALVDEVLAVLGDVAARHGPVAAVASSVPVLLGAGVAACLLAVTAKWVVLGRVRTAEHPLWSGFVWRTELVDAFVEELAVPWLGALVVGTPVMSLLLRALGARIGRDVWCETWWLPEADLVTVDDGAVVNRGCVLQTHLFHDRLMRLGPVRLSPGSTLGPHCVALPGATVGAASSVVGNSLVMRGESVPAGTCWLGNPLAAWPSSPASAEPPPADLQDRPARAPA